MEYKEIDNAITTEKQQIEQIENLIDNEKNKIKRIDSIQENITSITKNLNQCIDLLSESVKGPQFEIEYNDMRKNNGRVYVDFASMLDEESELTRKQINRLYEQKENILKEYRNNKEE